MLVRRPRAATAAAVLVLACLAAPTSASADAEDDLRAAQSRANKAAAELSAAQTASALAGNAVANGKQRVARLEGKVSSVRDQVRELAVRMYVDGVSPLTRLLRMGDANQIVQAQQFSHAIAATSGDALRQYRADQEDLGIEVKALEQDQEEAATAARALQRRQNEAVQEVDRLSRVVAAAQAARQAELRASAAAAATEAQARAQAAAAQGAPASPSLLATGPSPTSPAAASRSGPTTTASPPSASTGSGAWICPVNGPRAFTNDYGAARWGGGSHMGNDILSPRGTPVVASVDGTVTHRSGSVSGLSYYLRGDDGNEYFGAHLDSFGASGPVTAGTVVGYVGNTGDAAGGPTHLHFEIHPGGSGSINPYPTLSRYC